MKRQRADRVPAGRSGARSRPVLAGCRATVISLDGIGRQVALQLAALGVQRLQLVDARLVTTITHAAEGYADDDIGQPKVHAAAHACHRLNPMLEINAEQVHSLRGLDIGDAVFCCSGSSRVLQLLGRVTGDPVAFIARCSVVGRTVRVDVACHAQSWAACLETSRQPRVSPPCRQPIATPPYAAAIAAGLAVAEFARFLGGRGRGRVIRLDLARLTVAARALA